LPVLKLLSVPEPFLLVEQHHHHPLDVAPDHHGLQQFPSAATRETRENLRSVQFSRDK